MKRRSIYLLLIMLMLAPVFTLSCARDDVAVVRIQLENMPQRTAVNSKSIFERVFRWFVTEAWAVSHWQYPITSIECIISAPDLADTTFSLPASETELSIEVPAGLSRRITVYAGKDYPRDFGGHVELDLNPGDEVDAVINMVPVTTITYCQFIGGINVNWNIITPNAYGVIGYHIYRSDIPEGPYLAVGTANTNGAATSQFQDKSGPFITGNYYYYKVSAYTGSSEGEMSEDYQFYLS